MNCDDFHTVQIMCMGTVVLVFVYRPFPVHEKLNHASWWAKMCAAYLENVDFSIPHEYECIDHLKNQIY